MIRSRSCIGVSERSSFSVHTSRILSKHLLHRRSTPVTPLRPRSIVNEGNDRMDNATHTRVKFISSDQLIHGILASSSIFYAIPFEIYSYQGYIYRATFILKIVSFYHIYTSILIKTFVNFSLKMI